jgi:hypothetical protein
MPDNDKKKWTPRDLYHAPESFEEDSRKTIIYDQPRKRSKVFYVSLILAATTIFTATVLLLTGLLKLPSLPKGLFGSTQQDSNLQGTSDNSTTVPATNMPFISEIMANNKSAYAAGNGKYYDWVEIFNPTDHSINLSGFQLSDNPDKPGKFVLPDYSLDSGKFVIVFISGKKSTKTEIHASFKLKLSGTLQFTDPAGRKIQQVTYPSMPKDNSFAIDMSDFSKWTVTEKFTPGYSNSH